MNIKQTQYHHQLNDYHKAINELTSLQQLNIPTELVNKLKKLEKQFKAYDMTQHKQTLKKITGKKLSLEKVKKIVIDATKYIDWKESIDHELMMSGSEYYQENYGLDLKEEDVSLYMFAREAHNRNDVWLIYVACLPGFASVLLVTGRADVGTDELIENKEILSYIKENF